MSEAAPAVSSALSLPGFPAWSLWCLLVFFLSSIVIIVALLRRSARRAEYGDDDPWPGWQHHDGMDAYEAATDPGLGLPVIEPVTLAMQPEYVADITSFDMPAVAGQVVNRNNWAQAMTVPAPAIVARPTSLADEWLAAWESGEQADPAEWTRRVLESAGR
jgi:type III secretory pathway component EscV